MTRKSSSLYSLRQDEEILVEKNLRGGPLPHEMLPANSTILQPRTYRARASHAAGPSRWPRLQELYPHAPSSSEPPPELGRIQQHDPGGTDPHLHQMQKTGPGLNPPILGANNSNWHARTYESLFTAPIQVSKAPRPHYAPTMVVCNILRH